MIRNRVEELAGRRWAQEMCFSSSELLKLQDGHDKLLEILRRGLVQKPKSYAVGVQEIIDIAENVKP